VTFTQQERDKRLQELVDLGLKFDLQDFDALRQFTWHIANGYAMTEIEGRAVFMHSLLLGYAPEGMQPDHENRNKLDNRRSNLRFVTVFQNIHNSGHVLNARGIYKTPEGRWLAKFRRHRSRIYVGTFDTKEEAQRAVEEAKKRWAELHN